MIPLYGVQAHGGKIISLDDPAVVKDLAAADGSGGNAYVGYVLSTQLPGSVPGGYSRFRRLQQRVPHDGGVTVTITPWRDGQDTGQEIERELEVADNPVVIAHVSVTGSDFQVKIALSDFDAPAALGEAAVTIIPRRSER